MENTNSAISVSHCLAMGAYDYHKKNSVLRVTTAEWQSFLLQATYVCVCGCVGVGGIHCAY